MEVEGGEREGKIEQGVRKPICFLYSRFAKRLRRVSVSVARQSLHFFSYLQAACVKRLGGA